MRKRSSRKRTHGAKKEASQEVFEPGGDTSVDRAAESRRERSSITSRSAKQHSVLDATSSAPGFAVTRKCRRHSRRSTSRSLSSWSGDARKATKAAAADPIRGIYDTKQSGVTSTVSWDIFRGTTNKNVAIRRRRCCGWWECVF
ncbi:hypothetical protein MRX96_001508 [Rhipicephalus microplus]